MATFNKFQCFVENVAEKVHDLGADTLKILLTNTAPVNTNTLKANLTEISAGNGYTAGGVALTVTGSAQTSGTYKLTASDPAAWTAAGGLAGLALGLAVSVVLVHMVNPQSFHWSMDLLLPWPRLVALVAATVLAGTCTAWLAARAAAGRDAVLAVKEDW